MPASPLTAAASRGKLAMLATCQFRNKANDPGGKGVGVMDHCAHCFLYHDILWTYYRGVEILHEWSEYHYNKLVDYFLVMG